MTRDDVRMAVFGSFDGLTCTVGIMFGALLTNGAVFVLVLALAVSEAVSMAAGEWLADDEQDGNRRRRVIVMGLSSFVACLVPAIPFLFCSGVLAVVLTGLLVLAAAAVIAEIRPGPRGSSYLKTYGVLIAAAVLAAGASLAGQMLT